MGIRHLRSACHARRVYVRGFVRITPIFPTHYARSPVIRTEQQVSKPDSGVVQDKKSSKDRSVSEHNYFIDADAESLSSATKYGLYHFRAPVDQLVDKVIREDRKLQRRQHHDNLFTCRQSVANPDRLWVHQRHMALSIAGHGTYSWAVQSTNVKVV